MAINMPLLTQKNIHLHYVVYLLQTVEYNGLWAYLFKNDR